MKQLEEVQPNAYQIGWVHGNITNRVYDPPWMMTRTQKDQYHKGFHDARKARGVA